MKRHDEDLNKALKSLDQDVIWAPHRFEKKRAELSSKLYQGSVKQMSRRKQPRKKFIPVIVTLAFIGVFAAFIFNMVSNHNQVVMDDTEENEQSNAGEKEQTNDTENQGDVTEPNEEVDKENPPQPLEEMFDQEKELEIELEGMKETIPVELATNNDWRYIIYVEKDRYVFNHGETSDRIELKEPLDDLPEVAMEIRRLNEGVGVSEAVDLVEQEISDEGLEIERNEEVTTPLVATSITALGEERTENGKFGHQWDTPVHQYYVTQSETGHVYIMKQTYFLEAAEGHGSRFDQLLETFQVIP